VKLDSERQGVPGDLEEADGNHNELQVNCGGYRAIMVLRGNTAIHRTELPHDPQGVRWRFKRLFNDVLRLKLPRPSCLRRTFGSQYGSTQSAISKERYEPAAQHVAENTFQMPTPWFPDEQEPTSRLTGRSANCKGLCQPNGHVGTRRKDLPSGLFHRITTPAEHEAPALARFRCGMVCPYVPADFTWPCPPSLAAEAVLHQNPTCLRS